MTTVSSRSAKYIAALNNELTSYVKEIELKFKNDELRSEQTIVLVNNIARCSYKLRHELNSVSSKVDLRTVVHVIAQIYAICEGALDHYEKRNTTSYYMVLVSELEPWIKAYSRQKDVLNQL
jgi:hypothetical protein